MGLFKLAIVFLVISIIAGCFGFGNIAEGAADIAKILFYIFITICAILFLIGFWIYKKVT